MSSSSRRIIRHFRTAFRQELLTLGAMKRFQAIFGAREISIYIYFTKKHGSDRLEETNKQTTKHATFWPTLTTAVLLQWNIKVQVLLKHIHNKYNELNGKLAYPGSNDTSAIRDQCIYTEYDAPLMRHNYFTDGNRCGWLAPVAGRVGLALADRPVVRPVRIM